MEHIFNNNNNISIVCFLRLMINMINILNIY